MDKQRRTLDDHIFVLVCTSEQHQLRNLSVFLFQDSKPQNSTYKLLPLEFSGCETWNKNL